MRKVERIDPLHVDALRVRDGLLSALSGGPALALTEIPDQLIPENIALLIETGGSTGAAKIVALSSDALRASARLSNTALGATIIKAQLSTIDPNVSPVIDLDRISTILVKNIISAKSQQTIPETNPSNGNAAAKYVTRMVTLAQGFEADNISVFFDANMQSGSSIEVYAKVLAADDNDTFNNKPWVLIPNTSSTVTYSSSATDYMEQEYTLSGVSYTSGGVQYNNFQSFAIKVVMYSDDATVIPQIKNFRAIATS